MTTATQRALLKRARETIALDQEEFAAALKRFGGAERVEALTAAGCERLIDYCIVRGFRDRRRPILSLKTRQQVERSRKALGISDYYFETLLRSCGGADLRDLSGLQFLHLLAWLERYRLDVEMFNRTRREITDKQLKLLQVARRQLDLPDARYFWALQTFGGVNTASDLDARGFELMLIFMEIAGFEPRDRRRDALAAQLGVRPGMATPEQLALVASLWREWSGADDKKALNSWLERFYRVSDLRFLTAQAASKAINGLRVMVSRGHGDDAA